MVQSYLELGITGSQLLGARKYCFTAIQNKNILGHSYLEPEKTGLPLFGAKNPASQLLTARKFYFKAIQSMKIVSYSYVEH